MVKLPELKFSYGVVERALAVAYRIPEERRAVGFRAMLSNVQRLGALGAQARRGRGVALSYTPTEFNRLILALEFCELGIPPATAVSLIDRHWEAELQPIVHAAGIGFAYEVHRGKDVILGLIGVGFRTGSLRGEKSPVVSNIERCSLDDLPAAMNRWMTGEPNDPAPPRALVVNLSARLRAFHGALADTYMDELAAERGATLAGDEPLPKARK